MSNPTQSEGLVTQTVSGSPALLSSITVSPENDFNLEDLTTITFAWYDYLLFVLLLGLSVAIGLYYAFFSRHKQNNTNEYILGGKTMSVIPVAISLVSA